MFVEVKLRRSADFAQAMVYVDSRKQQRLRTTASLYLSQHPTEQPCRFDVIEIYAPQGTRTQHPETPQGTQTQRPEIHHMEDAFQ